MLYSILDNLDNLDDAGGADYDASMRRPDPGFVEDPENARSTLVCVCTGGSWLQINRVCFGWCLR